MKKADLIARIKEVIKAYGDFSVSDVEADYSPCVNTMGNLVALAEGFTPTMVEINVYEPEGFSSDSMQTYTLEYNELTKEILQEIYNLAKAWVLTD